MHNLIIAIACVGMMRLFNPCIDAFCCEERDESLTREEVIDIVSMEHEDDVNMLAHLIFSECGSNWCTEEMQYLTGSVVINRVNSEDYPNTIEDVINQKGQYSCSSYYLQKDFDNDTIWEIAKELIVFGTDTPANLVYQSQFKQGKEIYKHIGNQYYCLR